MTIDQARNKAIRPRESFMIIPMSGQKSGLNFVDFSLGGEHGHALRAAKRDRPGQQLILRAAAPGAPSSGTSAKISFGQRFQQVGTNVQLLDVLQEML